MWAEFFRGWFEFWSSFTLSLVSALRIWKQNQEEVKLGLKRLG
jgi:hypothetical protein